MFGILVLIAACALCPQGFALTIIPTFDSTITSDPNAANIEATINDCIADHEGALLDPMVVNITFEEYPGLGTSFFYFLTFNYSAYRSNLLSKATSAEDTTAVGTLPNTTANPVNGNNSVGMTPPLARIMGLSTFTNDGTIGLNISACNVNPETDTDPSKYALYAVASHEIDEILGVGGPGSALDVSTNFNPTDPVGVTDLFRYSASGVRSYNTNASTTCYLSIDGGVTSLVPFNQNDTGDFGDFASSSALVQNAFGSPGAQPSMSVEWNMLDVVGYHWNGNTNVWCNSTFSTQLGTVYHPDSLPTALSAVPHGGVVLMKAGTYSQHGLISTVCQLRAVNGTATIQ
jgi:hypothetical protein